MRSSCRALAVVACLAARARWPPTRPRASGPATSRTRTAARTAPTKDHTAACVEKCMKGGSKAQL